jgi:hypothetical protein
MTPRSYATPAAFRQALEQRLRAATGSGVEVARHRQLLVFARFLARIVDELGDTVTLKGGLAMELRLERARTTRDVDLRVTGSPAGILEVLRSAARRDLGDFMVFAVSPDERHPEIQGDGMKYDGMRFKAKCTVAGKIYSQPFGVDVAFGDPILGEPDTVVAEDVLAFAGIVPPTLRLYPVETHIAEKLHAFTMPRSRPNSRVKDLPDLALIATAGPLDSSRLRAAIEQTFSFRGTHGVPLHLPDPPPAWEQPYAALARTDGLRWTSLKEVTAAARSFLNPVLASEDEIRWEPATWTWAPPATTP